MVVEQFRQGARPVDDPSLLAVLGSAGASAGALAGPSASPPNLEA
jgi:hypothetical protein